MKGCANKGPQSTRLHDIFHRCGSMTITVYRVLWVAEVEVDVRPVRASGGKRAKSEKIM